MQIQEPAPSAFELNNLLALNPIGKGIEDQLACATAHSITSKGSLNRARLATAAAIALGMPAETARRLGGSLELFHLASLILDDLPCMDDAAMRRGQPCTHVLFGESTAILTAMGFINRAYFQLWEAFSSFPAGARKEAACLTDQCLGLSGILNGQARDIAFGRESTDAREILEIARLKTGSLMRLCLLLPAILLQTDRRVKMHLARLADLWGTAYQISDDLKDIFCGEQVSGKTNCRDDKLGRPNLALEIGDDNAMSLLKILMDDVVDLLSRLAREEPDLAQVLMAFHKSLETVSSELVAAHSAA